MYVKCKGNFMEVKCFVILLITQGKFKGESESTMQKICNRIQNPPIFWPDYHPWYLLYGDPSKHFLFNIQLI